MVIKRGRTYCNEHNERRRVAAIEGDTIRLVMPLSGRSMTMPLADFERWATGEYEPPE